MPPLDFPSPPTTGQIFNAAGVTWRWDGTKWTTIISTTGITQHGWAPATGTATRTAFATGAVTLPALAEHVKALIDDLIAYGAIGP